MEHLLSRQPKTDWERKDLLVLLAYCTLESGSTFHRLTRQLKTEFQLVDIAFEKQLANPDEFGLVMIVANCIASPGTEKVTASN